MSSLGLLVEESSANILGTKDTTTQTIESIWPLSKTCRRVADGDQRVLSLRTFVEEVLKRSKTSYSTLLVSLQYLILVMASVPKWGSFTMEQVEDSEGCRAMQCGRRMFLAALILASKYLQDKNYSIRAWGKMSGLQVAEINTNERVFLAAVNFKLHIPHTIFQRWERVVLRYSPPSSGGKPPRSCPTVSRTWQSIIPQLNPELDQFDDNGCLISDNDSGYYSSSSNSSSRDSSPHAIRTEALPMIPMEPLPPASFDIPRCLEPKPQGTSPENRMLPPLQPREGPLPTPMFTPQNLGLFTPAVSASGLLPRTSSMAMAMALSRKTWDETLLDKRETFSPASSTSDPNSLRRFSRTSSGLSQCLSPPDSAIWDESKFPSRSSSISSVASSTSAASRPDLAWQAMHRCANMQSASCKGILPSDRKDSLKGDVAWINPFTPKAASSNTLGGERSVPKTDDAPMALYGWDLRREPHFLPRPQPTSNCRSRKRERSLSTDLSLHWAVRDTVRPRLSMPGSTEMEDNAAVLPDKETAESQFLRHQDGPGADSCEGPGQDLRWLAAAEVQAKRHGLKRMPTLAHSFESETDSNLSGPPRKKQRMLDLYSPSGQKGISVRRGNGNVTPLNATPKGMAPEAKSTSHLRSTSDQCAQPPVGNKSAWINCSQETRMQAAGAELDRMLRVSRGECFDDRPFSRGGKLWGEVS